ncbi:MAG: methyltransferase domain-containing protein [Pseudomonadota bacterium]
MHVDVVDLRTFYYRTRLGRLAQNAIRTQVLGFWPECPSMNVLGFGFPVPLLRPYLADARRVTALMPAQQGVMPWPAGQDNISVLCEETSWPVEADVIDRLIMLHGLETGEDPVALLDECYRVLAPEGRGIFIVPNRAGLWARRDATPFGFGRPYSLGQLEAMLAAIGLKPERHAAALFPPPSDKRFWMRTSAFWEKLGNRVSQRFAGGVLIVEVTKQVPAPPRTGLPEAFRRPLRVLDGLAAPEPKPV